MRSETQKKGPGPFSAWHLISIVPSLSIIWRVSTLKQKGPGLISRGLNFSPVSGIVLGLVLCGLTISCQPAPGKEGSLLPLTECQLQSSGLTRRISADCGVLSVPEDRDHPDGRQIDLRVAIVRAVSRNPKPDPLFFLTGGPGQAATESFVRLEDAFRRILRDRDIVLVDQRGTGASNPLRCPKPDDEDSSFWILDEATIVSWVEDCLSELDADPRFYTTSIAMQDLDDVRQALGIDQLNLYGISYGTRAALTYLRRFPDRVRTVILDGVAPPPEVLGVDIARDAQRAFDMMAERCASDELCQETFPHFARDLEPLMQKLEEPVSVSLRHPSTGKNMSFAFDRSKAGFAVRLLSYSQESASIVPLLLRSAGEGDWRPLAAQYLMTLDQLDDSIADGMGFSVVCAEDFPFFDPDEVSRANAGTYLGAGETDNLETLCPLWPKSPIPDDFKDPVRSDVPVLLLSGEADPVTPPENAEQALRTLSNSLHLVAPGQGHMVIHRGCIPRIASDFIEAGALDGLDTGCVDDIAPQPFFLSFSGPLP